MNQGICFMYKGDYLPNFYEDYMNRLSTISHSVSLALHKNFLLVCFLLKVSWKEFPPRHLKKILLDLNCDLN